MVYGSCFTGIIWQHQSYLTELLSRPGLSVLLPSCNRLRFVVKNISKYATHCCGGARSDAHQGLLGFCVDNRMWQLYSRHCALLCVRLHMLLFTQTPANLGLRLTRTSMLGTATIVIAAAWHCLYIVVITRPNNADIPNAAVLNSTHRTLSCWKVGAELLPEILLSQQLKHGCIDSTTVRTFCMSSFSHDSWGWVDPQQGSCKGPLFLDISW